MTMSPSTSSCDLSQPVPPARGSPFCRGLHTRHRELGSRGLGPLLTSQGLAPPEGANGSHGCTRTVRARPFARGVSTPTGDVPGSGTPRSPLSPGPSVPAEGQQGHLRWSHMPYKQKGGVTASRGGPLDGTAGDGHWNRGCGVRTSEPVKTGALGHSGWGLLLPERPLRAPAGNGRAWSSARDQEGMPWAEVRISILTFDRPPGSSPRPAHPGVGRPADMATVVSVLCGRGEGT